MCCYVNFILKINSQIKLNFELIYLVKIGENSLLKNFEISNFNGKNLSCTQYLSKFTKFHEIIIIFKLSNRVLKYEDLG